jgi:hypothetical protein
MRDFKNTIEEAIELLGYGLIMIGILELLLLARRVNAAQRT